MIRAVLPTRPVLCTRLNAYFSTSNIDKHREFLNNFNSYNDPQLDTVGNHSSSVKPIKGKTIPSKERFNRAVLEDEDMYSGRPVWQQLNDIEAMWKIKFRHKSRIKIQRDISRAKKSTETLEELGNNANDCVYLDDIRNIYNHDQVSTVKDGITQKIGGETAGLSSEETVLINDINLQGNTYYEKPLFKKQSDASSNSHKSVIDPNTCIKQDDVELLTEIFGSADKNFIDTTTPSAIIEYNTGMEPEKWLNMNPSNIIIQQTLLKSKTPSQIFMAVTDKYNQLNHVNLATALHRLAKQIYTYSRHSILNHESFGKLVGVIENHISDFDAQGLTSILWSVVKIKITPTWLPQLFMQIDRNLMNFNTKELSSCLLSLSKVAVKNSESLELRSKLVSTIHTRITEFKTPLELTCISSGLARLNVRDPILFGNLSRQIIGSLDKFSINEVRGVAWAFAYLGFNDRILLRKIKYFIENNVSETNIRDLIGLAWALSKLKEADSELFLYTISPLIRSHVSRLTCKDISTISWAFVNSEIEDSDLFNDLATALQYQMEQMTTHDIASCVTAFSHLEASHKILFNKMKARAMEIANEFTPLQLAKIIRGFSYFSDEKFYSVMSRVVESKLHLMSPENIVEVLVGFTEAKIVPDPLFSKLLHAISKNARKMYAEDSLILLRVANELKEKYSDHSFSKTLTKLSRALLEQIEERVSKWRCFDLLQISLVFKCTKENIQSSLVKTLAKQFASCLNRLYSSDLPKNEKIEIFYTFLESLSSLNALCLEMIRTETAKNVQLMAAFHKIFSLVKEGYEHVENDHNMLRKIDIVFFLVNIGFVDDSIISMCNDIMLYDETKQIHSWEHITKTIWFFTEVSINNSWVKDKLYLFLKDYECDNREKRRDHVVRAMWSSVVLGEDDILIQILQKYLSTLDRQLPNDMLSAQQIALHILKCLPTKIDKITLYNSTAGETSTCNTTDNIRKSLNLASQQHYIIGEMELGILTDWLQYQREDLFAKNQKYKRHVLEIDYDSWISECLISMKIPHKALHIVENVYRVSVSFPIESHILDVITFKDMLAPEGKIRASALLRQRQLQYMGYGICSVKLSNLYRAIKEKSAKNFIARAISGFNPIAKEHVSFRNIE